MPIFESVCPATTCPLHDVPQEHFYRSAEADMEPCDVCDGPTVRTFSRFAAPFMGSLKKYTDPKRENASMEGFWAYKKVSSISGQPEPVYLSSMAEVCAFNRAEGLAQPGEVPTNATISADGKRILSDGMPGQWRGALPGVPSRLWEMNSSLTSLTGKEPAQQEMGAPCTVQVVDNPAAAMGD